MASQSLLEDCQYLIEKGEESWKSYFSKWENIGKQEDSISENFLSSESNDTCKPAGKKQRKVKKKQPISQTKRKKTKSILTCKKNLRNKKKIIKRKRIQSKKLGKVAPAKLEKDLIVFNKENEATFFEGAVLESNLKSFFRNFLIEKNNKLEIFGVLSLTFSRNLESNIQNLFFNNQLALSYSQLNKGTLSCMNQQTVFQNVPDMILSSRLDNPIRHNYVENLKGIMNYPENYIKPLLITRKSELISNRTRDRIFNGFDFHIENNLNKTLCVRPTQKTNSEINKNNKNTTKFSLLRFKKHYERSESDSLDLDSCYKSPTISRLNNKYIIKKNIPKMTVTLDRKRFKDLYLQKSTINDSLSMKNSNFTTPQRKKSEQKCSSENVLQRKKRRSSKFFFDNEEDSESDDQTEKRTPIIHCKSEKPKTEKFTEVFGSDSDEFESIFDRIKKV